MAEQFVSDTQVSQPINYQLYSLDHNMNGFGWDTNRGMFIPVDGEISYFSNPLHPSDIKVIPND